MTIKDLIQSSLHALIAHRMRSLLTMLGIIIGVGSVVLMVSVGRTFEAYIIDQIEALGGNIITIYPAGLEKFGRPTDTISVDDYNAIKKLSTIESISPSILVQDSVSYGSKNVSPQLIGTDPVFFENYNLDADRGRLLTERDVQIANTVIVLSSDMAEKLFETRDPLGRKVTISGRNFEVVGVLESVGTLLMQDLERNAYIPYSTARSITGKRHIDFIVLTSKGDDELARTDITALLRARHRIRNPQDDPDKDDFIVRSTKQATDIIGTVTLGLTVFLGLVAGIALLVGGIGIMNIMLVAVTERTKEIGLRKALGARRRDILIQFLIESSMLTTIGGSIGIAGGIILGVVLSFIAQYFVGELRYVLPWSALLASISMAVGSGLIFGIYPAMRASNLSPIDAMRRE